MYLQGFCYRGPKELQKACIGFRALEFSMECGGVLMMGKNSRNLFLGGLVSSGIHTCSAPISY